jgi:hypothetical protein
MAVCCRETALPQFLLVPLKLEAAIKNPLISERATGYVTPSQRLTVV